MPEPDKDTHVDVPSSGSKGVTVVATAVSSIMDLDVDFDVDNPWPLDPIGFVSNPMSPFLIASSEQPCSPLWAFADADKDDRITGNLATETETPKDNDENRRLSSLPSPFVGLVPLENSDGYCMIKERMTQALRHFKESTEQHFLAQVWMPVKVGSQYVLTTSGQPFVLGPHSSGLHQYRIISLMYMFSVDGDNDGELGLPGRVFWQKLPEWTPDVQYYSSKEYSRLDHARYHNVRGTMALPVFEPFGQFCVGVIELIMTSQKINYAPDVDKLGKALEAVNLKSSEILNHTIAQICNEGRRNALAEILEILSVVCETHKLPLAQTWVPCRHRSVLAQGGGLKKSCSSIDISCMGRVCLSITDVAFYIVDGHIWGFREACVEHHLQKGQGVAGRAFFSLSSCFCNDITQFCKSEYPLVHYAHMFGLASCFAICLRSAYTGDDDYILEFFLPPDIKDSYEQRTLLGSILATMKQHFQSLKVASGVEYEEDEGSIEIIEASVDRKLISRFESIQLQSVRSPPGPNALPKGGELPQLDLSEQQLLVRFDTNYDGGNVVSVSRSHNPVSFQENKSTKKTLERKRGKTEKSVSLEVLQQYFSGSLKDAAKSLGVCPTTMKRICRQHGISRWPSRKINKVNRSLSKLKHVIESVQGADGTFGSTSLTTNPLPVAVGSISRPSKPMGEKSDSPNHRTSGSDDLKKLIHEQNALSPVIDKGSNSSRTGSGSREESAGTPTSHGSCQGSPAIKTTPAKDPLVSAIHEPCFKARGSSELAFQTTGDTATEPQELFGGMLVKDAGSSKDLRNLCPVAADAIVEERFPESSWPIPRVRAQQEMKSVTIKATYREDIIRFRISLSCGIVELKEEVSKRLKLEVGTFDIKYVDDDQEWVLIACDGDLRECLDISRSVGNNIIRLSIHDLMTNLGSSCESTGDL